MADFPTLSLLVQNIGGQVDQLLKLVTAIGYLTGMIFVIRSLFFFKQYGDTRASNANANIFKPIINLVVGMVLLHLPRIFEDTTQTLLANIDESSAILSWLPEASALSKSTLSAMIRIVQLVGWIAFIRGWVLLVRIGEQGGQKGEFSKALLYIIGGVLTINVYKTIGLIATTLFGMGT